MAPTEPRSARAQMRLHDVSLVTLPGMPSGSSWPSAKVRRSSCTLDARADESRRRPMAEPEARLDRGHGVTSPSGGDFPCDTIRSGACVYVILSRHCVLGLIFRRRVGRDHSSTRAGTVRLARAPGPRATAHRAEDVAALSFLAVNRNDAQRARELHALTSGGDRMVGSWRRARRRARDRR